MTEVATNKLQIGTWPAGPTVLYAPTPGIAQGYQITGARWAQGAEVINSALLFPNRASDAELNRVETCIDEGP